jgi:hypothetical protein
MPTSPISTKVLAGLGLVLLLGAVGYRWLDARASKPTREAHIGGTQVWPEGRWHARDRLEAARERDQLARVLSLPYTGTGAEAPLGAGVTSHDPARSAGGVNLYTSGHAPEVVLMDMEGQALHRWRLPFERAFPGKAPTLETPFFRRAQLLADGSLLAIYQGGGMVKLDRRSGVLWAVDAGLYNDFHVARDGSVYAIAKEARSIPSIHASEPVLEDAIVVISPAGEIVRRVSLLAAFLDSSFAGLLEPMPESGDIFHTNTVDLLEGERGEIVDGFESGRVLVSLREVDVIALVDLDRAAVVWAERGPWDAQHQPELLPSGRILLFDNKGEGGDSRVLELAPLSREIVWEYRGESDRPLRSPEAGTAQRLENGNTLITESETGRAIEITPEGEIVWEFVSPHRGGSNDELVATLFEVLRLPEDTVQ